MKIINSITTLLFISGILFGCGGGSNTKEDISQLTITTETIEDAVENIAYSQNLQASGGNEPYHWSISTGHLPEGLQLNSLTGEVSGTPSLGSAGNYSFTIIVEDNLGDSHTQNYELIVEEIHGNTAQQPFTLLWKELCGTNSEVDNVCRLRRNSGDISLVEEAFRAGNDFVYNFNVLPFEENSLGETSDTGGRSIVIDFEGYMNRVLVDGGAQVEQQALELAQDLLALQNTYGRKVYVQLGNEISASVANNEIKIEELCQWASDPNADNCWIEPYVKYALGPFAKSLDQIGISVANGSISGMRQEEKRQQIYDILDQEISEGVKMHTFLDTTTGHYMIGTGDELNGPVFLEEVISNTVLADKVQTHIQTEEVGDNLAEAGRGGSSFLRVLMRTLTYALTHEMSHESLRFLSFGANKHALEENITVYAGSGKKIASGTGIDAIELLDTIIGDKPLHLANISASAEAHAFAHDHERYALLVYQKADTDSPETVFIDQAQLDCKINSLASYYIGDEGLILFDTASYIDETVLLNHEIQQGEVIFLHVKC